MIQLDVTDFYVEPKHLGLVQKPADYILDTTTKYTKYMKMLMIFFRVFRVFGGFVKLSGIRTKPMIFKAFLGIFQKGAKVVYTFPIQKSGLISHKDTKAQRNEDFVFFVPLCENHKSVN